MTTLPDRLSASKEGSFAYRTVKDRLPSILVTVIDTLHKEKEALLDKYNTEGTSQLKDVIGRLSKLRYEMMTNKPLTSLEDKLPDAEMWNESLRELTTSEDSPSWFKSSWLYVECLMYRQIVSSLHQSKLLSSFDPFLCSKKKSYEASSEAIGVIIAYLNSQATSPPTELSDIKTVLKQFLELSLWGNRCDLSISSGRDNSQTSNPLKQIGQLDEFLLVDDYDRLWEYLLTVRDQTISSGKGRIDLVLDNAGFEFLSDICLAELLIALRFASKIVFHMKSYPWFVSDTTEADVKYCIGKLQESELLVEKTQGNDWVRRVTDGSFVFKKDLFWTLPHDFAAMRSTTPDLYSSLARSNLLIFKGDLNYRKLVGDRKWQCETTSFDEALQKFNPAPILSLRTLKSDVCVGLENGTVGRLEKLNKDWMEGGDYAVMQFTQTILPVELPPSPASNGKKNRVGIKSTVTIIE